MVLRKLRWAVAGVIAAVALVGSPARSDAASVSIQEIDMNGNAVGAAFSPTQVAPGVFTGSSPSFGTILLTVTMNAGTPATTASMSTTYNLTTGANLNLASMPGLAITVTGDGFTQGAGQAGTLTNTVGASSGIGIGFGVLGVNQVGAQTVLQDNGVNLPGSLTGPAIAENPGTSTGGTNASTGILPSTYSITQLIVIRAKPPVGSNEGIASFATFSGTISSTVDPVPAPAGVVLALIALPALGLRRVLLRKNAAATA